MNLIKFLGFISVISEALGYILLSHPRVLDKTHLHALKPTALPDLSQSEFPDIPEDGYDLIVLGSGPGGESAAVLSAQLGARVAVVEKKSKFGGPTGLTSKAVREATKRICKAVDQVGGDRRRQIQSLWKKRFPVLKTEAEVLQAAESRDKLKANGCDLFIGSATITVPRFLTDDEHPLTVRVCRPTGCVDLPTKYVCIATGSSSARPEELRPGVSLPFSRGRVICSTEMGSLPQVPKAAAVIGGGVIAVEYATVLAELGVGVSLLCSEQSFLPFLEPDLRQALRKYMTRGHILLVEEPIASVKLMGGEDSRVEVNLESPTGASGGAQRPRRLLVDLVLFSGGRNANSDEMGCREVGVRLGKFGRIVVDANMQTTSEGVYAVGDVTGSGLASAAQQKGRFVAQHLFGRKDEPARGLGGGSDADDDSDYVVDGEAADDFFVSKEPSVATVELPREAPLTLWTIPEISSVGATYQQAVAGLSSEKAALVIEGFAYYKDTARGRLSGDADGFLKVVARADSAEAHRILGVHIIGEGANELIQLGSLLVTSGTTAEQVSNTPFAAVTMSGLYQVACDDVLLKSPLNPRGKKMMSQQGMSIEAG